MWQVRLTREEMKRLKKELLRAKEEVQRALAVEAECVSPAPGAPTLPHATLCPAHPPSSKRRSVEFVHLAECMPHGPSHPTVPLAVLLCRGRAGAVLTLCLAPPCAVQLAEREDFQRLRATQQQSVHELHRLQAHLERERREAADRYARIPTRSLSFGAQFVFVKECSRCPRMFA